jgi:hypothetical protein
LIEKDVDALDRLGRDRTLDGRTNSKNLILPCPGLADLAQSAVATARQVGAAVVSLCLEYIRELEHPSPL